MTAGAQQFVTPLTFQALSGRAVRTDLWDAAAEAAMGHIELAVPVAHIWFLKSLPARIGGRQRVLLGQTGA